MSAPICLGDGHHVVTGLPRHPDTAVTRPPKPTTVVAPVPGPPGQTGATGAKGDPGPAFSGIATWYGDGPPDVIVGAKPGDLYIDVTTGTTYELT